MVALVVLIVFGLLSTLFLTYLLLGEETHDIDVFLGIDIAYGDDSDVRKIVDAVEGHINLVILGSLQLTMDTEKLTETCEYLYQKGLSFIVYVSFAEEGYSPPRGPDSGFFTMASERWGDRFLGVYLFDEVGGKQVDQFHPLVSPEDNLSDATAAAILYVHHLEWFLGNTSIYYTPADFTLFTSDYALHWFDYVSGYDVVFSEFIANNSRPIAIALGRGAARALNRDWGIMITWKYDGPPFLKPAPQLYNEMVLAYENGAKYIIVFNSPEDFEPFEYGGLTREHVEVIKDFWNHVKNNPRNGAYTANTAYVLPKDYGYGFRGPDDKIWGLWEADELTLKIWEDVNSLLVEYGSNLDIVYETKIADESIDFPYNKLIFWNGTIIEK
jgi:hypothetical protein